MRTHRATLFSAAVAAAVIALAAGTAVPASADEPLGEGDVMFWELDFDGQSARCHEPGTDCVNLPFTTSAIANMLGELVVYAEADCEGATYLSPDRDLHSFPRGFLGLSFRATGAA